MAQLTPEQYAANPYYLKPGESVDAYNQRIAGMNTNLPAPGTTSTTGVTNTAPSGSTLSSANLQQNTSGLNIPTYNPPSPPDTSSSVQTIQDLIKQYQTPSADVTAAQTEQGGILSEVQKLLNQQGGQAARQSELETKAGIPDLTKNLNDINALIKSINASAFSSSQKAENRQAPTFAIYGEQAQIERQKSVQTYGLAAAASALQGNIALAQDNVKRAIDTEFGPLESKLKYQMTLLDLNKEKMSKAEQKQADTLKLQLQAAQDQLDTKKKDKETIYGIAMSAAQNGAPSSVVNAILNSGDLNTALGYGTGYLEQSTAASIQEYNFAVKNGYKGSFSDYQNEDANRKIAIAKAGVGTTGLSTQQYNALQGITTKFQADPIINLAVKGATVATIADQIIANPSSATSQLKSLYVLVKNLDPDSAVREGELALANQTQSYLAQWGNTLARINEGRIIDPKAAANLAQATKELLVAWNSTAQKRQQQYNSQANTLGVGNEFGSYISGSNLGYNQPSSQQSPQGVHITRNGQEGYISSMMEFNPATDKLLQ